MNDLEADIKTFGVFFDFVYHLCEEDTPVLFSFLFSFYYYYQSRLCFLLISCDRRISFHFKGSLTNSAESFKERKNCTQILLVIIVNLSVSFLRLLKHLVPNDR